MERDLLSDHSAALNPDSYSLTFSYSCSYSFSLSYSLSLLYSLSYLVLGPWRPSTVTEYEKEE